MVQQGLVFPLNLLVFLSKAVLGVDLPVHQVLGRCWAQHFISSSVALLWFLNVALRSINHMTLGLCFLLCL